MLSKCGYLVAGDVSELWLANELCVCWNTEKDLDACVVGGMETAMLTINFEVYHISLKGKIEPSL